jgi:hypothetical protein
VTIVLKSLVQEETISENHESIFSIIAMQWMPFEANVT